MASNTLVYAAVAVVLIAGAVFLATRGYAGMSTLLYSSQYSIAREKRIKA